MVRTQGTLLPPKANTYPVGKREGRHGVGDKDLHGKVLELDNPEFKSGLFSN